MTSNAKYSRLSARLDRKQSARTRAAYIDLQTAARKRPNVSEATLDRKRAIWKLSQLRDLGIVQDFEHQGGIGYLVAAGSTSQARYKTVRHLEAFIHGAFAALES